MALKLSSPTTEDFYLVRAEELYGDGNGDPSKITIRQATQGDHERRSRVFAEISRVVENEMDIGTTSVQLRQRWSMEELKRVEVFLTLAGCDIIGSDGSPLFRFNTKGRVAMSEQDFFRAWASLPPEVAREIHDAVLKVNFMWAAAEGEAL